MADICLGLSVLNHKDLCDLFPPNTPGYVCEVTLKEMGKLYEAPTLA